MQYSLTAKKKKNNNNNDYFKVIENPSETLPNIMCFYLTTILTRAITETDVYLMESEAHWLSTLSSAADAFHNTSE